MTAQIRTVLTGASQQAQGELRHVWTAYGTTYAIVAVGKTQTAQGVLVQQCG